MKENPISTQIIARAWKDKKFKSRLLKNPKAVLEKEFSLKLPDDVELKILEETTTTTYLTLPIPPDDIAPDQLSRAELEKVALMAHSNTDVRSGCKCCSVPCSKLPRSKDWGS